MPNTTYVASLLSLMSFKTYDQSYVSRMIVPGREEMELVLDGQAVLKTPHAEYRIGPGDLIWHRPGDQTICSNKEGDAYECVILSFKINPHRSLRKSRLNHWTGSISARQFAEDALRQLGDHINDSEFAEYLYCALKVHSTPVHGTHTSSINYTAAIAYDKAFQYISTNFRDKALSIDAVANAATVSASQLHTLFKEQTELTPYQLINRCRMEFALSLLAENRTIKQVACMSGFDSESGFIRAFKKTYGSSPGLFKKKHQERCIRGTVGREIDSPLGELSVQFP
ncbi:helix-turn-helix transcriptional regulator [Reinekea forsetii]|nr:helix-turn-helix transcriptional regulator [Reinekea forsetii]